MLPFQHCRWYSPSGLSPPSEWRGWQCLAWVWCYQVPTVWLQQVQSGQWEEFNQHGYILCRKVVSRQSTGEDQTSWREGEQACVPCYAGEQLKGSGLWTSENSEHVAEKSVGFVFPTMNSSPDGFNERSSLKDVLSHKSILFLAQMGYSTACIFINGFSWKRNVCNNLQTIIYIYKLHSMYTLNTVGILINRLFLNVYTVTFFKDIFI